MFAALTRADGYLCTGVRSFVIVVPTWGAKTTTNGLREVLDIRFNEVVVV
jgi:hypothetical protein